VSGDTNDHALGWSSYENMLGILPDSVILIDDNAYGESWETGGDWSDGTPARSGEIYVVDGTTDADRLRTPHNAATATFPGDSLKIVDGGGIWIKAAAGGEVTVFSLISDGGRLVSSYTDSTVVWKGALTVQSGGLIFDGGPGPLVVDAALSGSGPIRHNDADRETTLNAGTWGGDLILGGGTLRFGYDITDGGNFTYAGGTFDFNGRDHQFQSLVINGTEMGPGIYNAAELGGGFAGDGTIQVGSATSRGTPYAWLESYGLLAGEAEVVDVSDPDGDGLLVWQEYVADTDPTNAGSALMMTDVRFQEGGVRIDWQGGSSSTQFLECIAGLGASNQWNAIYTNLPDTLVLNSFYNAGETNEQLFYRIRVERPAE
jgi:hypothetical protein